MKIVLLVLSFLALSCESPTEPVSKCRNWETEVIVCHSIGGDTICSSDCFLEPPKYPKCNSAAPIFPCIP